MRQEAETHAEEDIRRKELIEARNTADNAVYTAEKALRDLGDKVPDDVKTQVDEKTAEVRQVMESEDAETIRKATEELFQVVQQIGASAYEGAGPEVGETGADPEAEPTDESDSDGDDEDVVDGEFRNV
jgi:molecular chaperone DnaK